MKTIRIIKRAQLRDATEVAADESKKPVEPTARSLADTVKSWIAETEQRKRTQRHSLAALGFLVLIAFTVGVGFAQREEYFSRKGAKTQSAAAFLGVFFAPLRLGASTCSSSQQASNQTPPIKVTIATTAGFLGQPNNRFKVGEQIPVSITMTNTSAQQLYTCVSSDLYQDRPKLTRDGKVVPYLNAASYETRYARRNQVCKEENIPEQVLLEPNKPTVADWLVLVGDGISTQADAWYDSLPAGKYELSIQRQLACCDGPMVESNKINFEVVP